MLSTKEKLDALREQLKNTGTGGEAWGGLLDLCQELTDRLGDLEEAQEDLSLYIETIDEDLTRLEGQLFGGDEDEEEEEVPLLDLTCPYCQREIRVPQPEGDRT